MAQPTASELELQLRYDNIPLSKRLALVGTTTMTKNSLQTVAMGPETTWGQDINFVDKETGYTPLMAAAVNGNPSSVATLIERGAELNYQEPKRGRTALILACKHGRAEVVAVLLHRGAAVSITDRNGVTALMWAAKNGFLPCVVSLLAYGSGINTFDNFDWTAVHYAAKFGHREIVEVLANAGAALQVREKLEEGKTPLMLAAQYGRRDTVNVLIDLGSDVNVRTTKDDLTALHLASKEGHKGTVKALLVRGADANASDAYGWTALHFSASWGRKETALILITEGGARVNAMPRKKLSGGGGTTPLIIATKGQQVEVMAVLLEHGADPLINDEATGRNPLAYAAAEGLTMVVSCLIAHNVDLNVRDARGMTPLMLAVIHGHAETIRLLLAAVADINVMDADGKTALDHAVEMGRQDIYLHAILRSSAACKAEIITWVERDLCKMIRGSPTGGPAIFLSGLLYGADGLYSGLYLREPERDAFMVHNLVMVAAACTRAARRQPMEAEALMQKVEEIDDMLLRCMDSRAFVSDFCLSHSLVLQNFPEAQQADGQFDYRYFGGAFVSGPLALYIDSGLSRFLGSVHVARVINRVFSCSLRGPGVVSPETGYGGRTNMLRLRYCPAFMFYSEGLSRLLHLALLVAVLRDPLADGTYFSSAADTTLLTNEVALMIHSALLILYDVGCMEELAWASSPSVSVDPVALAQSRQRKSRFYMFSSVWKVLDLSALLLVGLWAVLKFTALSSQLPAADSSDGSALSARTIGHMVLSIGAIPLCLGLLRYPVIAFPRFGELVLATFSITRSLFGFLVLYAVTGAGFGIALNGMFQDLLTLNTYPLAFRTLFDAINKNFDLAMFDESVVGQKSVGAALLVVFVVWTVFVLFNTVAAHIVSTYPQAHSRAHLDWLLLKAGLLTQYLLIQEKSPMCMLPAPFNALPASFYFIHVLYTWRARLFSGKVTCVSFAGTVCDVFLSVLFLLPAAFGEYFSAVAAEPVLLRRSRMIASAPIGVSNCFAELATKVFCKDALVVRLFVKSRLKDGRLRMWFGDSRDKTETIGLVEKPVFVFKFEKHPRQARGGTMLPGEMPESAPAKVAVTNRILPVGSTPQDAGAAYKQDQQGQTLGDQGFLWSSGLDDVLARTLGDEEKLEQSQAGADPTPNKAKPPLLQSLGRQDSSVSLMSDVSSGEMLQRFPQLPTVDNSIQVDQFAGLFLPHERRDIFSRVLADVFQDEALAKERANNVGFIIEQFRHNLYAGLEDVAARQDRQFDALVAMLGGVGGGRSPVQVGFPDNGLSPAGSLVYR